MSTERIMVDLPAHIYDILRADSDISAYHRREILQAVKVATTVHLSPVCYEDDEIAIAMPDKGIIVNGRWTPLPESERTVLHKLLAHGGWVPIAHLYGHPVTTRQDKSIVYKWVSALRRKIGRHRIANCQPGMYRFVGQEE